MNFYYLLPPDDSEVATLSGECDIDFVEDLQTNTGDVLFYIGSETLNDIQANDLGWPLFSKKVKDAIDSVVTNKSHYVWCKVSVATPHLITEYYVPQFLKELDVLDTANSIYADGGFVVKACIEPSKAHGIGIFPVPGSDSRIIISYEVYCAISERGVETAHFEIVSTNQPGQVH